MKDILGAPLPVIVYVAPSGAGAGSAGVFITMAAHVAAMAPGHEHRRRASGRRAAARTSRATCGEKVENFTASFSEAIAGSAGATSSGPRRRCARASRSRPRRRASSGVVDFVARDLDELLARADGRKVEVGGRERTLAR